MHPASKQANNSMVHPALPFGLLHRAACGKGHAKRQALSKHALLGLTARIPRAPPLPKPCPPQNTPVNT